MLKGSDKHTPYYKETGMDFYPSGTTILMLPQP